MGTSELYCPIAKTMFGTLGMITTQPFSHEPANAKLMEKADGCGTRKPRIKVGCY